MARKISVVFAGEPVSEDIYAALQLRRRDWTLGKREAAYRTTERVVEEAESVAGPVVVVFFASPGSLPFAALGYLLSILCMQVDRRGLGVILVRAECEDTPQMEASLEEVRSLSVRVCAHPVRIVDLLEAIAAVSLR